jgi:flagellum-specific peptidoglycan hydrolase FlgJ
MAHNIIKPTVDQASQVMQTSHVFDELASFGITPANVPNIVEASARVAFSKAGEASMKAGTVAVVSVGFIGGLAATAHAVTSITPDSRVSQEAATIPPVIVMPQQGQQHVSDKKTSNAASIQTVVFGTGGTVYEWAKHEVVDHKATSLIGTENSFNVANHLSFARDRHLLPNHPYEYLTNATKAKSAVRISQVGRVIVRMGNTLDGIDQIEHVSQQAMALANPEHPNLKTNPNYIQAGWVLNVPNHPIRLVKHAVRPLTDKLVAVHTGDTEWDVFRAVEHHDPAIVELQQLFVDRDLSQSALHHNGLITDQLQSGNLQVFKQQHIATTRPASGRQAMVSSEAHHAASVHHAASKPQSAHLAAATKFKAPVLRHYAVNKLHVTKQLKYEMTPKKIEIAHSIPDLSAPKIAYLLKVINGTNQLMAQGAKINPEVMDAQAMLESGWGQSKLAAYNNFFGMKAPEGYTGSTVEMLTSEYVNGEYDHIMAKFMTFPTAQAGLQAYVDFIQSRSYFADAIAHANNPLLYVEGLQNKLNPNGTVAIAQGQPGSESYATSPTYVPDIMATIKYNHIDKLLAPIVVSSKSVESVTTVPISPSAAAAAGLAAEQTPVISKAASSSQPPTLANQGINANTNTTNSPELTGEESTTAQKFATFELGMAWTNRGHGSHLSDATPQYQALVEQGLDHGAKASDCSAFIKRGLAGTDIDEAYPQGTTNDMQYVRAHPKEFEVYDNVAAAEANSTNDQLEPGDILINRVHTYAYVGPQPDGYNSVSASLDDHVPEPLNMYPVQNGQPFIVARLK